MLIDESLLSEESLKRCGTEKYKQVKMVASFLPKKNYVVHYMTLQVCNSITNKVIVKQYFLFETIS